MFQPKIYTVKQKVGIRRTKTGPFEQLNVCLTYCNASRADCMTVSADDNARRTVSRTISIKGNKVCVTCGVVKS